MIADVVLYFVLPLKLPRPVLAPNCFGDSYARIDAKRQSMNKTSSTKASLSRKKKPSKHTDAETAAKPKTKRAKEAPKVEKKAKKAKVSASSEIDDLFANIAEQKHAAREEKAKAVEAEKVRHIRGLSPLVYWVLCRKNSSDWKKR